MWRCLNRLCTGVARTKTELRKWGFVNLATNTTCQCVADDDTVQPSLKCSLLDEPYSTTDLCQFNENARRCVGLCKTSIQATPEDLNTCMQHFVVQIFKIL